MNPVPFVISPRNYPPALPVLGTRVTVLAANTQTKSYELTLQSGDEGTGPPPHSHPWDESFFVLRGTVEMFLAGQTMTCSAGTLVHVPAHTVHGFAFGPDDAELLELTGAGGRATRMFEDVSRAIAPGSTEVEHVVAVLERNQVTVARETTR